jgi:hypothetical protein
MSKYITLISNVRLRVALQRPLSNQKKMDGEESQRISTTTQRNKNKKELNN